eukprot:UN08344
MMFIQDHCCYILGQNISSCPQIFTSINNDCDMDKKSCIWFDESAFGCEMQKK